MVAVQLAVAVFALVMGVGVATIWTLDLARGRVDLGAGLLHAREGGDLLWPHWLAEYATAAVLIVGAIAWLAGAAWADGVLLVGLGALVYTSVNSLGWVLADHPRQSVP
ncbi:MAG TPA: hypothetical protein VK894_12965, partial [Jiangellales bacterium]|nr:hypothetical protein [Jiangellales bacterium]